MGVTLFISVLPASSPEHFMQMMQPYVQAKCIFNIQFSNGEIEKAKDFGILGIILDPYLKFDIEDFTDG